MKRLWRIIFAFDEIVVDQRLFCFALVVYVLNFVELFHVIETAGGTVAILVYPGFLEWLAGWVQIREVCTKTDKKTLLKEASTLFSTMIAEQKETTKPRKQPNPKLLWNDVN